MKFILVIYAIFCSSLVFADPISVSDVFQMIRKNDLSSVQEAIKNGMSPNSNLNGDSLLTYSLRMGRNQIVDWLCDNGATGRRCTGYDLTASTNMFLNCRYTLETTSMSPCLTRWLTEGADPDFIYRSDHLAMLLQAIRHDDLESIKVLLSNGAHIEQSSNFSWTSITPLMWAAKESGSEIVSYLVQKGAFVDPYYPYETSALAISLTASGSSEKSKFLIKVSSSSTRQKALEDIILHRSEYGHDFDFLPLLNWDRKINYNPILDGDSVKEHLFDSLLHSRSARSLEVLDILISCGGRPEYYPRRQQKLTTQFLEPLRQWALGYPKYLELYTQAGIKPTLLDFYFSLRSIKWNDGEHDLFFRMSEKILRMGIDINGQVGGEDLIFKVIKEGVNETRLNELEYLISRKAKSKTGYWRKLIEGTYDLGNTPDLTIRALKMLFISGDSVPNDNLPFYYTYTSPIITEFFLNMGSDVTLSASQSREPLVTAILRSRQSGASADSLRLLVNAGAKGEERDWYFLTYEFWNRLDDAPMYIDILIDEGLREYLNKPWGVTLNSKRMNLTPLMASAFFGRIDTVKKLLEVGAIKELRESVTGKTALDFAIEMERNEIIEILKK